MKEIILSRAFACSDAREQAELLNDIARELFVVCGGRRNRDSVFGGYEPQCCEISRYLNKDGIQFITDLYEFIQLRKKDME